MHWIALAKTLSHSLQSQHCSLVTLTLHTCCFLSDAFTQLTIGIGRNTSLHRIAYRDCLLNSAQLKLLANAVRDNKTLKEVIIDGLFVAVMIDEAAIQALEHCNQNVAVKVKLGKSLSPSSR